MQRNIHIETQGGEGREKESKSMVKLNLANACNFLSF